MKAKQVTWNGVKAVELSTPALSVVGVYEYGPRLSFFGKPGGDNLLLWDPEKYYRTAPGRDRWYLRGGHRAWMAGIGADECEMTYNSDNEPAVCQMVDSGFRLTSAFDPQSQTRRGIEVRAVDDNTLEVDSFVKNEGDMLLGAAMWALTCSVPSKGTQYVIPLGDGTCWDSACMVLFNQWAGHGQKSFADNQYVATQDAIVINPQGLENKRMIQSQSGIIAMSDPARGLTFAKKADYRSGGRYPLNCNIAAYIGPGNFMVEMETMGEETTLKPGEELHHVETWKLADGAMKELTGKAARALFA